MSSARRGNAPPRAETPVAASADRVVGDTGERQPDGRAPQRADRDRARDRERVEPEQPGRVAPGDEGGEEDERRDHPAPSLAERRLRHSQEDDKADDERGDPERDVQAERHAAEENVAEDSLDEGRAKDGQSEPRAAAHAALMQTAPS
jgi:hypothetical protein